MNMFNLENPSLTNGLKHMIEFVKSKPEDHLFFMERYSNCVIGERIGNRMWVNSQIMVMADLFGLEDRTFYGSRYLFSESSGILYSNEEWAVIRLFTTAIGNCISAKSWLLHAEQVLYIIEQKGV